MPPATSRHKMKRAMRYRLLVPVFAWLDVAEGGVDVAEASAISRHLAVDADGIATDVKDECGLHLTVSVLADTSLPQERGAPSIRSDAGYCPEWASEGRITPSSGAPGEIDGIEVTVCRLRGERVVYFETDAMGRATFIFRCDYGPSCAPRAHLVNM